MSSPCDKFPETDLFRGVCEGTHESMLPEHRHALMLEWFRRGKFTREECKQIGVVVPESMRVDVKALPFSKSTPRQKVKKNEELLPCPHRGEILEHAACVPCRSMGVPSVAVYECKVHGKCTLHNASLKDSKLQTEITACSTCDDLPGAHIKEYPFPTYITYQNLLEDTLSLIPQLWDIDAIVGVARSGMLPASILSLHMHLPLYYMTSTEIAYAGNGFRMGSPEKFKGKALIIDDTLMLGNSLKKAISIADQYWPNRIHGSIYLNPKAQVRPDVFAAYAWPLHLLEWNLFNGVYAGRMAFDFDGVLCPDIPADKDDDGDQYIRAIKAAHPLYAVRRQPISIITARLEKYRHQTLEWLESNRIKVNRLVMGPWRTKRERSRADVAAWKAGALKEIFPDQEQQGHFFVESDPRQAKRIAELSNMTVICTGDNKCYQ